MTERIALAANLPLPTLIDVELEKGAVLDMTALEFRLSAIAPGAVIDDHGVWLGHLVDLIQTVRALALAVLLFIATATIGTVIFATRTGLAIHHEAIEVLHLIGALRNSLATSVRKPRFDVGVCEVGYWPLTLHRVMSISANDSTKLRLFATEFS